MTPRARSATPRISLQGRTRATFAVILARGLGTRLRADDGTRLSEAQADAASRGAKGLVPIHGHPLLDYLLDELAEGGVRDVAFVIAPDDEAIRKRYDDEAPPARLRPRYATQAEPRGTADALLAAREAVEAPAGAQRDENGVRHFLVCNADNLYPAASVEALVALDGPGLVAYDADALCAEGALDADRVRQFALLDIARDGTLRDIVEKPAADHPLVKAKTRWVSMNLWRVTDAIFAHCAGVAPSPRGELELGDAVRAAIAAGDAPFRVIRQRAVVRDLSQRCDIAELERQLAGRTPRP
jgi:glucose-1-phosphate thymidylyltransferase